MFRVCVSNRMPTAVSQMFHYLYFHALAPVESSVTFGRRAAEFVKSVDATLAQFLPPNYVLDIALSETENSVVDVHPHGTDMLLFNWVADEGVLRSGPLAARTCTRVPERYEPGSGLLPSSAHSFVYRMLPRLTPEGDEEDAPIMLPQRMLYSQYLVQGGATEIAESIIGEAELDMVIKESIDGTPLIQAAVVLMEGYGVARDYDAARTWILRAKDRGHLFADEMLALLPAD